MLAGALAFHQRATLLTSEGVRSVRCRLELARERIVNADDSSEADVLKGRGFLPLGVEPEIGQILGHGGERLTITRVSRHEAGDIGYVEVGLLAEPLDG